MTAEMIEELPNYKRSKLFRPTERMVLEFVDAMTATPVEVPEELFARLQAEFTEDQLVELTSAIAWENYRARFDHAFGIGAEGFSEGAYCAIPAATRGQGVG